VVNAVAVVGQSAFIILWHRMYLNQVKFDTRKIGARPMQKLGYIRHGLLDRKTVHTIIAQRRIYQCFWFPRPNHSRIIVQLFFGVRASKPMVHDCKCAVLCPNIIRHASVAPLGVTVPSGKQGVTVEKDFSLFNGLLLIGKNGFFMNLQIHFDIEHGYPSKNCTMRIL